MTAERLPETQVMLQQLSDAREVLRSRAASVEPKEVHKLLSAYLDLLNTCVSSLHHETVEIRIRSDLFCVEWSSSLGAPGAPTYRADKLAYELAMVIVADALAFASFGEELVKGADDVAKVAATAFRAAAGRLEYCAGASKAAERARGAFASDAMPPPELAPAVLRALVELFMAQAEQMTMIKAVETGKSGKIVSGLAQGVSVRYAKAASELESYAAAVAASQIAVDNT